MSPLANDAIEEWVEAVVGAGKNPPGVSISIISECQVIELKLEKIGLWILVLAKYIFGEYLGDGTYSSFWSLKSATSALSLSIHHLIYFMMFRLNLEPKINLCYSQEKLLA